MNTKIVSAGNGKRRMETGDHFKNGASSKSLTSRGKFFRKACFALLASGIVFWSCNKPEENQSRFAKIDMKDAALLFIAPSNSTTRSATKSSTEQNRLFKITDDGIVEEVSYLDEDGNEINESYMPEMIYHISNSDYFVVTIRRPYDGSFTGYSSNNYLVRKSDGAVFLLPAFLYGRTGGYVNSDFLIQDANKNIYFMCRMLGEMLRVYKVDISDPNNLTLSPITPDTEDAYAFTVSAKGDILYSINQSWEYRLRKSNGGLYNIPHGRFWGLDSWTGFDGKIKYVTSDASLEDWTTHLYSINISENGDVSIDDKKLDFQDFIFNDNAYLIRFSNRVLLIGRSSSAGFVAIHEVENVSNSPRIVNLSYGISTVKNVVSSDNYYYLRGNNSSAQPFLIKVNPANDAVTELFSAGAYDIYAMAVSANDELTFNALRMNDGRKVIGKITSSGALQIIDDQMDVEVTVLQRIQ